MSSAVIMQAVLFQGCSLDTPFGNGGEGSLSINTEIRGETRLTRADNALANSNPEYYRLLEQKCVVFIENSRGVMRKFKGLDNIPTSINLSAGQYVCNAWTGDSVSASFDSKFYRGQQTFEIAENQNTSLSMKCNIANVVVSVDGASVAETGLKNAKITFSTPRGSLEFDESMFADKKGYFMTPSPETKAADPEKYAKNTTVTVKVEGTTDDGKAYVKESNITDVQRAHEYQVVLTANQQEIQEGGALIQLVIKDIPVIEDTVEIFPAPIVKGYGFDMTEQLVNTDRTFTDQKLYICEYKGTGSVMTEFSENFTGLNGGNLFDNAYVSELTGKGITVERKESQDAESGVDVCEIYVTFPAAFLNGLAPSATQYVVTITATDSRNLVTTSSLRIANTNEAIEKIDDVVADPAPDTESNPMAVLASKATLKATLFNADAARYGFKYRKAGTSDWKEALATGSTGMPRRTRANVGTPYSVTLTGLESGTTYEYKAFADEFESAVVQTFTTESIFQIPNSSMEQWGTYASGGKDITFPGDSGLGCTFWDTGNMGGATVGMTMTDKTSEMKHSGDYGAALQSKNAYIALAAGNLFAGKFLGTYNTTNATLEFGRPYNGSHPSKLRVWANYRPGKVDKAKNGVPVVKGENDFGQIYIALSNGVFNIDTGKSQFFNPDSDQIVAYGEVTWNENYGPDGELQELEIPLEYKGNAASVAPTHIIIVCCASKYGDYYAGSTSSVMYLDDFELVYE